MEKACGGVVVNAKGSLLLSRVETIGGYLWPLVEKRDAEGETPEKAALRAVADECGYEAEIIGRIPKTFGKKNELFVFYLMRSLGKIDWAGLLEDVAMWVNWRNVKDFLVENGPPSAAQVVTAILDSALEWNSKKIDAMFQSLNGNIESWARETHDLILQATEDALPLAYSPDDSSECIQYCSFRYPNLLSLKIKENRCTLDISPALPLKDKLKIRGFEVRSNDEWDMLDINSQRVVDALGDELPSALASFFDATLQVELDKYALPLIQIDLKAVCRFSEGIAPQAHPKGETFTYHYEEVQRAALAAGENLDEFLTRHMAGGLLKKPLKRNCLFWYASRSELILITVCDRYLKAGFGWLRNIPGYYDSAQDYLQPNAVPFMFWDGNRLFRIYPAPDLYGYDFDDSLDRKHLEFLGVIGELQPTERLYVNNFGVASGITLLPADRESYKLIATNKKGEYFNYSVVPTTGQSTLSIGGKEFTLHHAYFDLVF